MLETLFLMLFPILGEQMCCAEFQYTDLFGRNYVTKLLFSLQKMGYLRTNRVTSTVLI